jgi:KaiC/GvpD/RAD55 family RecA-like ATPase
LLEEQNNKQESDELDFVTTDLDVLINEAYSEQGLRWRLDTLNKMLGSLRKGDFGFVFARPETGKTTFLASEISYMLDQTDGDIFWFNNEEQHNKVMLRVYQAFFGVKLEELYANIPKFQKAFQEATQGRLKMPNLTKFNRNQVEKYLSKAKTGLILFDQIDKIEGFEADREDLHLGAIYQWAREIAKSYAPTIGICQADGSGENQKWLTMANVANAKTSKQAEADWILGIGKIHDPGWEAIRFFHLSKNKLIGDHDTKPEWRHGKQTVLIKPEIARYEDMKVQQ